MEIHVEGSTYKVTFSRMALLDIWCNVKKTTTEAERIRNVYRVLTQSLPDIENIDTTTLELRVKYLCTQLLKYYKKVSCAKSRLISKYSDWLNVSETCSLSKSKPIVRKGPSTSKHHYRKDFEDCSKHTQRRRIKKLSKVDESAVHFLTNTSDQSQQPSFTEFSTDEVLCLILEAKLTKHQYLLFKKIINTKIPNTLPSYQKILSAKKECYPPQVNITESSAEVDLQSLLDQTTNRIVKAQEDVLKNIPVESNNFILIGKWGFDGSTGHSEYKQAFLDSTVEDASLFVTSYVPLELSNGDYTIWKNPRPSSTRFCRPIRFQFAKESKNLTVQEEAHFIEKIECLQPTSVFHLGREIKVQHKLQLTMVDGKVCSALTETASTNCYICGAKPNDMNNIQLCLSKPIDPSAFQFGLSPLHAWIRFFEYFLHLAYRLEFKKWQVRSDQHKALFAQKKRIIQSQFREILGLVVDKPRSGGSGNSNDGNTARKFFRNSGVSAEITGIEKNLIDRCHNILLCLASGYDIEVKKFKEYSLETARELINKYPWYNLPVSVHKVLIHGADVIENSLLPIGQLSEEAAESSNKNIRVFRRDYTRKMSRLTTNTDLFHRLLLHSDPYISILRKLPKKKKSMLPREVLDLLKI